MNKPGVITGDLLSQDKFSGPVVPSQHPPPAGKKFGFMARWFRYGAVFVRRELGLPTLGAQSDRCASRRALTLSNMCLSPFEPNHVRLERLSVARRPTAWSCLGTVNSSSASRNQPFAGSATGAALPARRRCPGTVVSEVPTRRPAPSGHGGGAVRPGPSTKLPSAVLRADLCPGGFGRYNSTILRLLLVPLPAVCIWHAAPPPVPPRSMLTRPSPLSRRTGGLLQLAVACGCLW